MTRTDQTKFGAETTTDEVLSGIDLSGKRVLITGTSAGLGVETARSLVEHGARVTGTVRDLVKGRKATEAISASDHSGSFDLIELDLASLASVRNAADHLVEKGEPIDVIIANAGVMATPKGPTFDGFETQFGTNHLGHFLLINRLATLILQGGRVVNLSSAGHRFSDADLDDPNFDNQAYDPWVAYGRSKTANVLFAVEFDRRHRDFGVRAAAVHPGGIKTELGRHLSAEAEQALIDRINASQAAIGAAPFKYKSIPQGAATSVWAAIVASADEVGGRYCEDCHVAEVVADATARTGVRPYAFDEERAKKLWSVSETLVGERF